MKKKKTGRVCCVIGGTSGIGRAIAEGFIRQGDIVIAASRNARRVKKVFSELRKLGNPSPVSLTCDVTKKSSLERLLHAIRNTHRRVDVLVVAAGMHVKKKAVRMPEKEWNEVIRTNLTGTFLANQVFGRDMCKKKTGCIINIGSLASYRALTDVCAYASSKAGVVMLTQCLAVEWAESQVRVNAIIPGVFPTPLNKKALQDKKRLKGILSRTPMKRLGKTEEIVSTALFLASPDSSFVTGACIPVDGGFLAWSGF